MRQILVDYARRHRAAKRGGARPVVSLDEGCTRSRTGPRACWRWTRRWASWRPSTRGWARSCSAASSAA
jgi:hypothetical protein